MVDPSPRASPGAAGGSLGPGVLMLLLLVPAAFASGAGSGPFFIK